MRDPDPATTAFAWHEECPRCALCGGHRHGGTCATCYDAGAADGRAAERQRIRDGARWLRNWSNGGYYVPADLLDGGGDAH